MSILRMIGRVLAALAVVAIIALAYAVLTQRDKPAAELEARYATPPSKFIVVDGVRFHYRDEGTGPVIVLVHANFSNLLDWEPWAEALKDRYRVVRFDMTSHGLTGPDPTGDYTLERTLRLTEGFVDALGLQRFTLAGISLGGTVSIHYASKHPERVERLILLNPGSLEARQGMRSRGLPKAAYVLEYVLPRALPRSMLASGFGDPTKLPESLVDRWYDLWMREGQRKAQLDRLSQYRAGDIEGLIRALRVPVLLMWGKDNKTAEFSQSAIFLGLLKDAPAVKFIAYPGLGHMALEEDGARLARDVRAWLDDAGRAAAADDATPPASIAAPAAARAATPAEAPPRASTVTPGLPPPASARFCVAMQQRMAGTRLTGRNRVFDDMAEFRHSKPRVQPLEIFQVVTYVGTDPVRVSCKLKTAAHIRAVYGDAAAGAQRSCPDITRVLQAEAVGRLRGANQAEAATRAAQFIVDADEPFSTGAAYLKAYALSNRDTAGRIHLRSIGLFQDYDSWITLLLPEFLEGQSYCHWPTIEYMVALATGAMAPGTIVTTEDDAVVTPRLAASPAGAPSAT